MCGPSGDHAGVIPLIAQSVPHDVGGGSTAPVPSVEDTTPSSGLPPGLSSVVPRVPAWLVSAIGSEAATCGITAPWARDACAVGCWNWMHSPGLMNVLS